MKRILYGKTITFIVLVLGVLLLSFWQLPFTFYQQDEWIVIGHFFSEGILAQVSNVPWFLLLTGSMRVLSHPFHILFYDILPFQMGPLIIFAILFHFTNSFLVYYLAKRLSGNWLIGIVAGIFFAASSVSHQAVTWAGASTTTLPSACFLFISIILYLNFLDTNKKKLLIFSFLSGIVSYLFKESSIFIFFLYPVLYVLFGKFKKFNGKNIVTLHWMVIVYLGLTLFLRFFDLLFNPNLPVGKYAQDGSIIEKVFFNGFMYPLVTLSQMYVPLKSMFSFAAYFERANYPFFAGTNLSVLIAERIVSDLLSVILSFIIIAFFVSTFLLRKSKYKKLVIFTFIYIIFSTLPFVIIDKGNAYLEPRYYYLCLFGGGILLGIFFEYILSIIKTHTFLKRSIIPVLTIYFLIALFIGVHIYTINEELKVQADVSKDRLKILSTLKKIYPSLPNNPVFYVTGNRIHYGPNQYVPFQEGTGYTLMVWYYKTGKIPKELLTQNFLWNVGEQGYKEINQKGFGYFADIQELKKSIEENSIRENQIIGVEYLTDTKEVKDITKKLRKELY